MRRVRVLLDANVLLDAQLRDLFLRMGEHELIDVRWSRRILEETRRAMVHRLGLEPNRVDHLMSVLGMAFPDATVEFDAALSDVPQLPDPDDQHVLAAAISGECDMLVTFNERDFPGEAVEPADLLAASPDDALLLLASQFRNQMPAVVNDLLAALRRPPMDTEQFLRRLSSRASMGAAALGSALGVPEYTKIFHEAMAAVGESSPQMAVDRLLDLVQAGDSAPIQALIDTDLAKRLTGLEDPPADALLGVLRKVLHDVWATEGWGWATAARLQAPNTELVKLVRAGDRPQVVFEPHRADGHLFMLQMRAHTWVLVDLDGPDPADNA